MGTPPTFVADYSTGFAATTSPRTVSVTVGVADLLAVMGGSEDGSLPLTTPSGGGLTYTLQQSVTSIANFASVFEWTAPSSSGQTYTLSQGFTGGGTHLFGSDALRFSGSDGVGASSKTNVTSGAPSLDITTTQDNSAICVITIDWNAGDGTSRTWRTVNGITPSAGNGLERVYFRDATRATVYLGYYSDAGAAGTKTVGLTAPTGQKYSIVAVEIKGTASSTPTWLPQPGRRRPPTLRVLPSTIRTTTPVRAQVNPPYPFQVIDQSRRIRGLPVRRGRAVSPVPAQVVVTAPAFPFAPIVQERRIRGLLPRRGRTFGVPLVGAAPPANPVLPLGVARRPSRLLAAVRRERITDPPVADVTVPPVQRHRPTTPSPRRRHAATVVQQVTAPLTPARRDRPDLPAVRRGKTVRPLGVQLPPVPPAWVPIVSRIRQWRPFHRAARLWTFLFPAAAEHVCVVERPDTGVLARPSTGTITRPGTGLAVRPDTGTVVRPDTGTVPFEC